MRAIVNTRPGGSDVLETQNRPMPEPGFGQVRVRVHASALNRADMLQRQGAYAAPPGASSDIPGLEYAGEVEAVGTDTAMWTVGDRVMGIIGGGAHAEYVCVHEREVMAMPQGMSFAHAAAIPEAFLTAYDALIRQLNVQIGERVLVHAVGSGVGTAALQLAHTAGATVLGTSRSPDKLERSRAFGLQHAIDASAGDWPSHVERCVGPSGVHAIMDLVGGAYLAGNVRVLAPLGRTIIVGLTAGRSTPLDMGAVLGKRLRIMGTMLRSRPLEEKCALARDFSERITPLFTAARLRPVVDCVLSFADIRAAHDLMESNTTFGKIVLNWD